MDGLGGVLTGDCATGGGEASSVGEGAIGVGDGEGGTFEGGGGDARLEAAWAVARDDLTAAVLR